MVVEASSQWDEGTRAIPEPLFAEDCGKLWSQDLESNEAIKLEAARKLDRRHPAGTKFALDDVAVREGRLQAIRWLVHLLATQDIRSALQYSAETDNASNRLVNVFTKSRTDLS